MSDRHIADLISAIMTALDYELRPETRTAACHLLDLLGDGVKRAAVEQASSERGIRRWGDVPSCDVGAVRHHYVYPGSDKETPFDDGSVARDDGYFTPPAQAPSGRSQGPSNSVNRSDSVTDRVGDGAIPDPDRHASDATPVGQVAS